MSHILKSPVQYLVSISSPWLFAQWGIDIVGPLPTAPAQKKLLLVTTDYFSKWIEADAFSSIKDRDVTWLSGKTLSTGLASQDQSCPIMSRSLTDESTQTFSRN